MTIGDDGDDIFKSGAGVKNIVTIVIIVTAKVWAGCRVPFTKGSPAGELSADSRGSAPPGVSERRSGQALPEAPSESPRHFAALGLKVS